MEQQLGPHSRVVYALRQYGKVRVDFLARFLGWPSAQVEDALRTLEQEKVVTRDGDQVALEKQAAGG